MPIFEHHAVVPAGDGGSLLTVDERLPCVRGEVWRLPEVLDRLAPLVGRPTYLRLAHQARRGELHLRLHVLDASSCDGDRVAIDEADAERLAPPELRPALEGWLAEQAGAPVPPERPAWARPGWHAEAEAWAGVELQPVRLWPLSAVLRGERADGRVYFKAVFPLFHHEPAVTEALAREHPYAVPELVAVDRERGWMLMRELPGVHGYEVPGARWAPALRMMGGIQRAWAGRRDELVALGAQDRRLSTVAPEVAAVPELARCLERLDGLALPETIGHGDLHAGNIAIDERGGTVIFDWSDACANHPLFDLAHFVHDVEDEQVRAVLVDAWAAGWGEPLPGGALELAAPLYCTHRAVSYRAINAAAGPEGLWMFGGEPQRWLEKAYRLARGNASQPG